MALVGPGAFEDFLTRFNGHMVPRRVGKPKDVKFETSSTREAVVCVESLSTGDDVCPGGVMPQPWRGSGKCYRCMASGDAEMQSTWKTR